MLPYPGGRHPRLGFLDGAIRPQRETKVSVFAPWERVVDTSRGIEWATWFVGGELNVAWNCVHKWVRDRAELMGLTRSSWPKLVVSDFEESFISPFIFKRPNCARLPKTPV